MSISAIDAAKSVVDLSVSLEQAARQNSVSVEAVEEAINGLQKTRLLISNLEALCAAHNNTFDSLKAEMRKKNESAYRTLMRLQAESQVVVRSPFLINLKEIIDNKKSLISGAITYDNPVDIISEKFVDQYLGATSTISAFEDRRASNAVTFSFNTSALFSKDNVCRFAGLMPVFHPEFDDAISCVDIDLFREGDNVSFALGVRLRANILKENRVQKNIFSSYEGGVTTLRNDLFFCGVSKQFDEFFPLTISVPNFDQRNENHCGLISSKFERNTMLYVRALLLRQIDDGYSDDIFHLYPYELDDSAIEKWFRSPTKDGIFMPPPNNIYSREAIIDLASYIR